MELAGMQVSAARLRATSGRLPGVLLGNFRYSKTGLQLGSLAGNLFTIVLRAVASSDCGAVMLATRRLKETGFVNYFGLQRFGSGTIATHEIGKLCGYVRV
jgi:tRNA pseudouridine13 synthase